MTKPLVKFGQIIFKYFTEDGSKLIAAFLETGLPESVPVADCAATYQFNELSHGNLLLLTLDKLSSSASLLECMSAAGVPSTLVKCLYIFLDLPCVSNADFLKNRIHFHQKFTQLLQRVCLSSVAVEEVVNADALRHLFSAAVDPCQPANGHWRKSSCMILTTLAQNCLTALTLQYIHDAGCIIDYLERLRQMQLPKTDLTEAFTSLFYILSESSSTSSQLLDDFHAAGGYTLISDYLLKLVLVPYLSQYELEEGEEAQACCQRLVRLLGDLIYIGPKELRPKNGAVVEVFQLPGFKLSIPKAKGEVIRNIRAIDTLQLTFLQARSAGLCNALLERVRGIHERVPGNYFILDKHHLISSIIEETFFDVFASLIENLRYVPLQEINSVALLLRSCKYPPCLQLTFSCLFRLVLKFPTLKEFYRNVGILEATIQHLEKCVDTLICLLDRQTVSTEPPKDHRPSSYDIFGDNGASINDAEARLTDLLITILRLLAATVSQSNPDVAIISNLKGIHCLLTRLLPASSVPIKVIKHALALLYEVFVVTPSEDQLLGLLDVLPSADIGLRFEIMCLLCNVLRDSHRCRTLFRKCNGFIRMINQLVLLNGCLSPDDKAAGDAQQKPVVDPAKKQRLLLLIKGIFAVITVAMKFEPASAKHFASEVSCVFSTPFFASAVLANPWRTFVVIQFINSLLHAFELQFESLEQTLRLLGCFTKETVIFASPTSNQGLQCQASSNDTAVSSNSDFLSETPPAIDHTLLDKIRVAFMQPGALEEVKLEQFGDIPVALLDACLIFRYLIGMAIDEFDSIGVSHFRYYVEVISACRTSLKPQQPTTVASPDTPPTGEARGGSEGRLFASPPSLVHTGAILVILRLIPAVIQVPGYHAATFTFQYFSLELLRAMVESERSQQLLCGGSITDSGLGITGMPRALLTHFRPALAWVDHPLHAPVATLFGLLTAHSLTPKDFRDFLRLSGQFCNHQQSSCGLCTTDQVNQGASPCSKAEEAPFLELPALSSITDLLEETVWRQRSGAAGPRAESCLPSFVEFDMSVEGFGCLFLPSLAPQRVTATPGGGGGSFVSFVGDGALSGGSSTCVGGVGVGERVFPPTGGITFCSWVCVDDFGTSSTQLSGCQIPHPVRLLTVFRGVQGTNEQLIYGSQQLSKTRSLDASDLLGEDVYTIVFPSQNPRLSDSSPWSVNTWRHVVLVFARASVLRNSLCTLYLDGSLISTQKILFAPPGSGSISTSVCAFVGTAPCQYQPCSLRWRQGPFQLIEEPLTAGQVALIAALGPEYVGSLQAPPVPPGRSQGLSCATLCCLYFSTSILRSLSFPTCGSSLSVPALFLLDGKNILQPLFSEEKLSFAACGSTSVTLTINRIRRVYNATDAALISKVVIICFVLFDLHMPLRENLTPIRILRNTAAQLAGPSRSLGAVLVGYQGVRVFSPRPLASLLASVANPAGLLLSFLALSNSQEQLKKSLQAVFCVIDSSQVIASEIHRIQGYELMAGILRRKSQFLNEDVVDLVMKHAFYQMAPRLPHEAMVHVSADLGNKYRVNEDVFRDLLCDLKLWLRRPLGSESESADYGLVAYLLDRLASHFTWLCGGHSDHQNQKSSNEPDEVKSSNLTPEASKALVEKVAKVFSNCLFDNLTFLLIDAVTEVAGAEAEAVHFVELVVASMRVFGIILLSNPTYGVIQLLCNQLVTVLGFDWFHLFLSPSVHDASAAHALRAFCLALLTFTGSDLNEAEFDSAEFPGLVAFRKDLFAAGWMRASTKRGQLGSSSGALPLAATRFTSASDAPKPRLDDEQMGKISGFLALSALLVNNAGMPEVYVMLINLLLGVRTPYIPTSTFSFDDLYNYLAHVISSQNNEYGLCEETVPPASFFAQKIPLHPAGVVNGVADFAAATEPNAAPPMPQTMHNSNLFDSVACPEAATVIISILSALMRSSTSSPSVAAQHMPVVLLQLFSYLYQSNFGFQRICLSPEFLTGLIDLLVISGVCQSAQAKGTAEVSLVAMCTAVGRVRHEDGACEISWRRLDELLLSFLRTIVVDSFSLPPTAHRPVHVVDTVLEVNDEFLFANHNSISHFPTRPSTLLFQHLSEHSSCSSKQQHEIQTVLMRNLMEYILAKDLLADSCLLLPSKGHAQHVPQNLAYFACRLVDKLWQGCFLGPISEIIDFITQLINMIEQHLQANSRQLGSPRHYFIQSHLAASQAADPSLALSRASLYRSLNRSILFQLSRPVLKQKDQKLAISMLQLLLSDEAPLNGLVFSSFNSADTEFPVCLAHLLIQHVQRNQTEAGYDTYNPSTVRNEMVEVETPNTGLYRTVFDLEDFETDEEERSPPASVPKENEKPLANDDLPAQQEEFEQLSGLALKLWEHCYMWNQKVFVALLPDSQLPHLAAIPSLIEWAGALEGPCIMKWTAYVDSEAAGCGGIVSQSAASSPSLQWGLLSMYGPSTIERQLESTNNKVTGTPSTSSTDQSPPHILRSGSGLSHRISKKLGRVSASVLRMASSASGNSGSISAVTEVSSAKAAALRKQGRQFSIVDSEWTGAVSKDTVSSGCSDAEWVLVPRIPIGLPLLTKRSTTFSTLKRLSTRVKNPITLIIESLEWSKQSQERNTTFLCRQVEIEWNKLEDELTQERSIWGPMCADDELARWELDPTEGPCRMRKRMLPNPNFYRHYPTINRLSNDEETTNSSAPEEPGNEQMSSAAMKRGYRPPQSLGCVFRHRRRRLLRGPEALIRPKEEVKSSTEASALPQMPASNDVCISDDLAFPDIGESEDTLLRTSRLLRDSKIVASRVASFADTVADPFCDASTTSAISLEEDTENDTSPHSSQESLDPGPDDPAAPLPPPTPPASGKSTKQPLTRAPSKPSSEGSSTALDQLTGHIAFMRLLEPGESLSSIYRCARICGLDVHEGLLLFGKDHFYVIDGYTLMNTHEIVNIEALPPGMQHKPIVPTGTDTATHTEGSKILRKQSHGLSYTSDLASSGAVDQILGNQYFKFAYDKIREVHRRRYLLQQTALEVFNADGRNFLLVFAKDFQGKVFECFTSASSAINTNRFTSLYSARTTSHLLSSLLGEKTVTQRWVRGEISNFQYLMYLNTQAGRSYNDLMQYPVFPWVVADYTSLELDLTRPSTFRDFTKPMGAQTPGRLAQFQRRFKEWDDPTGETPPYHYGTHYSSAMIVASYLVRMEPFAQHFIKLQGGHFDLPDRMFHSVAEAWLSASQHNMADVRELIPEFFYLPDFLVNSNRFDFGRKQNGLRVDDVILPPWAKGDPREFIRQHREALESEYVSTNLHHWIDLIFGYKQRGEPAVHAVNVFHHLFYEGNVDIYAIDDPVKRRAVVGFINNFGQIPRQIFRKPHPAKKTLSLPPPPPNLGISGNMNASGLLLPDSRTNVSPASSGLFFHNLGVLKPSVGAVKGWLPIFPLRHSNSSSAPVFTQTLTGVFSLAHKLLPLISLTKYLTKLRHAVGQILQLEPGNLKGFSSGGGGGGGFGNSALGGATEGLSTLILPPGGFFGIGGSSVGDSASGPTGVAAGPIVVVEQNMVLLPPTFTRYLAWGYPDDSFRICSLVGDKVLQVFEMVNSSQVLCAAAPNASTIVTAGMTGVVKVWQISSQSGEQGKPFSPTDWNHSDSNATGVVFGTTPSSLQLAGCLYGHTDVVTCLAASDSFNLIVSGSRDCTCIIWDLRYLIFLRQLGGSVAYKAPVAAVCISEATGDIAVCAGAWLYLWSITGELIACLNTAPDQNNQIYCVAMSTLCDWDPGHVIITGGSDGVVRLWGLDYVREESPDSSTSKVRCYTHQRFFPIPNSLVVSGENNEQKRWRRQLSLRADLTMHTAFDRSESSPSVPLMAIAISRDHRSVLVGDAKGRVFAWSVPGGGGGGSGNTASGSDGGALTDSQWTREEPAVSACAAPACGTRFSLTERKHHCRNCGRAFCSRCSRFESEIHPLRIFRPVRVCTDCYALLREQQGPAGN
ncbi:unnamed protein product [Mesocestoides corti]|uniref:WD repeat and FYVE domain-containing protein 3 n=1 Tax=Mesocestoides corti TaxID=53468 RepID=A0A3P6HEW4_MESCO|nr:unnamed protein product [Mesocestoides corti]